MCATVDPRRAAVLKCEFLAGHVTHIQY